MALNIINRRMVQYINTGSGFSPEIGPSNDHTDGTWTSNNIYSGEFAIDEYTSSLYIGIGSLVYNLSKLDNNNNLVESSNTITSGSKNIVFGNSNTINGSYNSVAGQNSSISGSENLAVGSGSQLSGDKNIVGGSGNQIAGDGALSVGLSNNITGDYSSIIGSNNTLNGNNSMIIGSNITGDQNNTLYTNDIRTDGNLYVSGNFLVSGTTANVNVVDMNIKDNIILLNSGETGLGVTLGSAGIEIDRGSELNKQIVWNELNEEWQANSADTLKRIGFDEDILNNRNDINSVSSQTWLNESDLRSLESTGNDREIIINSGDTLVGDESFKYDVNNSLILVLNYIVLLKSSLLFFFRFFLNSIINLYFCSSTLRINWYLSKIRSSINNIIMKIRT